MISGQNKLRATGLAGVSCTGGVSPSHCRNETVVYVRGTVVDQRDVSGVGKAERPLQIGFYTCRSEDRRTF